jgi:transposase
MEISTIGIDLSKTSFHVIGLNAHGEIVLRRKCSRKQLLHFTSNRQRLMIGMEACGGAHFLGRALRTQGHDARLMPAQFVKPFRKSNKNDYLDAEAIAEAVQRPTMRFVPIKTDDQLDLQALHRVRDRWVARRTAVMNQMRGFLMERGITVRKGPSHLTTRLKEILEDAETPLSGRLRLLILELKHEWDELEARIEAANEDLQPSRSKTMHVAVSWKFLASDRWFRRRWSRQSVMASLSAKAGISLPGWGWFHASIPPAVRQGCSASANAEMSTCDECSCTGPDP